MRKHRYCCVIPIFGAVMLFPQVLRGDGGNADPPKVVIQDRSDGCFHNHFTQTEYVLEGEVYVGEFAEFPKSYIDGLRDLLLSSREDSSDVLARVGVTTEKIERQRVNIYRAARGWTEELPKQMPSWAEPFLDIEDIRQIAFHELAGPTPDSTTVVSINIHLPGDPPIDMSSSADRAWMLPWTITSGGESWETYSLTVPKAIGVLADPKGPNAPSLDGTRYWADEFWNDSFVWGSTIGGRLNKEYSRGVSESLDGYEEAISKLIIECAEIGNISPAPRSLFFHLKASHQTIVDSAWWWNPLENGEPTCDWYDFLAMHEAFTNAAEPHGWLQDWKDSGPGRRVSAKVVGTKGFCESSMEYEIIPTWKAAGLAGEAEFQLTLYDDKGARATVFLGSKDPRALITHLEPYTRNHWLDSLSVGAPECLVVDRNGNHEKHRVVTLPKP
ncbi:MAG: hypothetical protein KDA54_04230 [Phycisphaerales bacterium]|nr:hypothetical protein [Phycisphaerales bacterium]